jgi:hypothetical protein
LGAVSGALSQPGIDRWQKELGAPPRGMGDKLKDVAVNAGISAAFGGLVKGAGHVLTRLTSPRQAVEAFDRAFPNPEEAPPELRQSRDILEAIAQTAESSPLPHTPAGEAEHIARLNATADALANDQPLPKFPEDQAKTDLPQAAAPAPAEPQPKRRSRPPRGTQPMTVMEFIASQGGLRDQGGELRARDLDHRTTMTRFGPAARRNGLSADQMRERLVEAGYLTDAGRLDGGPATTTATDVYDLIDRARSGDKVVPIQDQMAVDTHDAIIKAEQRNWALVDQYGQHGADFIQTYGGPLFDHLNAHGIDVREVPVEDARLARDLIIQGEKPEIAIERAALMNYEAGVSSLTPAGRKLIQEAGLDPIPGWETSDGLPSEGGAAENGGGQGRGPGGPQDAAAGSQALHAAGQAADPAESPGQGPGLGLTPDPAVVRAQLDTVPEPNDAVALAAEASQMEAELQARDLEGAAFDVAAATDGEFHSLGELWDSLKADSEFLDSVKVCLE